MMKNDINIIDEKRSDAWLLIFLTWIVYATSYLGKVNYSANIAPIIDFYGITKAQAGTAPTFFFFAYGAGQVVNGLLCKKYNLKWMIFFSLVISASINFIVAVTTEFAIIKWLWLVNGFILSILWPSLIRLLSEALPQKLIGISSVVMGTTVATGTLVIYALSSLFAAFNKFKLSFSTAAVAMFLVAFLWLFLYNKSVFNAKKEKTEDENTEKATEYMFVKNDNAHNKRTFFISVGIICFYAVGVNLIKDGLTTWVPSILKDEFSMSDSLSILLTLFLPILSIFGNAFALFLHKKIPEYINHCVAVFSFMSLFIGLIIGSLKFEIVFIMLIGLIVVNFFASSLNSLITSIFPMFMRGKVNSGLFAGVLNGFCYLGSTISSYGLGVIADNFGWTYVFWTLLSFCVMTVIVWVCFEVYKHYFEI